MIITGLLGHLEPEQYTLHMFHMKGQTAQLRHPRLLLSKK